MSDIKFVDGLIVKAPHENAPDFVKCAISIKRKELGNWLRAQDGDWINIDVKESKGGKWYAAVNDYKPENKQANPNPNGVAAEPWNDDDSDLPF
jgi:hypothetical protein